MFFLFGASRMRSLLLIVLAIFSLSGCAAAAVAGAAVSVAATAVRLGAAAVETTAEVAAAGVRAAVGDGEAGSAAEP